MFIALYGINNIGKSTQVKKITEYYQKQKISIKTLKYPVYSLEPTGPQINYFLRDPEAEKISPESFQMLYIQNRLDYEEQLNAYIEQYDIVLAEDYTGTGIAWGMTHGGSYRWFQAKNMQNPQRKPDKEILMDGNRFSHAAEKNHLNESDDELMNTARDNFLFLARRHKWKIIDANQSVEKVTKDIVTCINFKKI